VGFVVIKVALGQIFSGYSASLVNHSSDCSILIISHHQGLVQYAVVASVIVDSVPLHPKKEKKYFIIIRMKLSVLVHR
jgi:hypothetical protein